MATCPKCGYLLGPRDRACPRCQLAAAAEKVGKAWGESNEPIKRKTSPRALAASGALAGAINGAIIMTIFAVVDRLFTGMGDWLPVIIGGLISGALLGALVGLLTVMSHSVPIGLAAGASIFALLHGVGFSSLRYGAGFNPIALFFGLLYGAVFGWLVAGSTLKSVKRELFD
jgi:hypothetical protein